MSDPDFQRQVIARLETLDNALRGDADENPGVLLRLDRIEQAEVRAKEEREKLARQHGAAAMRRAGWMQAVVPVVIAMLLANVIALARLIVVVADLTGRK